VCSRREAEALIAQGRVSLNGHVLTTPAVKVAARDELRVDGQRIANREVTRLWLYHKPSGLVTTHKDPAGRPTVFAALPEDLPRVVSVGRLDLTTEGLLLLTNDGELSRALELPGSGLERVYRARAYGKVTEAALEALALGVTVDGVTYGSIVADVDRVQGDNAWLTVRLKEGKKREVRFALEYVGLTVNRLIRVSYGPFSLADLPRGEVIEAPPEAVQRLKTLLRRRGAL
jgi:23S rRNA pseudouridine2605 synthase